MTQLLTSIYKHHPQKEKMEKTKYPHVKFLQLVLDKSYSVTIPWKGTQTVTSRWIKQRLEYFKESEQQKFYYDKNYEMVETISTSTFDNLINSFPELIYGKQEERYSTKQDEKIKFFLENVLSKFLVYPRPENHIEKIQNDDSKKDDIYYNVTDNFNVGVVNNYKPKTQKEQDETYIAHYLDGDKNPLLGLVTISLANSPINIIDITIFQAERFPLKGQDKANGRLFKSVSIDYASALNKEGKTQVFYCLLEEQTNNNIPVRFQSTIEVPVKSEERNVLWGSFSSVRLKERNQLSPSAGWAILIRVKDEDIKIENNNKIVNKFDDLVNVIKSLNNINFKYNSQYDELFSIQYYLNNKMLTQKGNIPSNFDQLPTYTSWLKLKEFLGVYKGTFFSTYVENEVLDDKIHEYDFELIEEEFLLEISPTGKCKLAIEDSSHNDSLRRIEVQGFARSEGDFIYFYFDYRIDTENYTFKFTLDATKPNEQNYGVFSGIFPIPNKRLQLSKGILSIRKEHSSMQALMFTKRSFHIDNISVLTTDTYAYFFGINNKNNILTDYPIVRKIAQASEKVMADNRFQEIKKYFEHDNVDWAYFTYRIPFNKSNANKEYISDYYRIEKSRVIFLKDNNVQLYSPSTVYNGKAYYNGSILFMSLYDERNTYISIQLNFPSNKLLNKIDFIYGTSTWKGHHDDTDSSKYLESKIIVLAKRVVSDKDTAPKSIRIGDTDFEKNEADFAELLLEDKNYKGVCSYLAGEFNRNLHAPSDTPFMEPRPRDTERGKLFFSAAIGISKNFKFPSVEDIIAKKGVSRKEINRLVQEYYDTVKQVKEYLWQAYVHGFASYYFAGDSIDKILTKTHGRPINDTTERFRVELEEQEELSSALKTILNHNEITDYAKSIWNHLYD